jgi:hypothetical protein
MSSENEKEIRERLLLMHFLDRTPHLLIDRQSIEKVRGDSMPDFKCRDTAEKELAFEITAPHSDGVGRLIGDAKEHGTSEAIWTGDDDIERLLRNKLDKTYNIDLKIDLVLSWTQADIATDDMIIEKLIRVIDNAGKNPFRRIWYDGEHRVYCLFGGPV